jgi:hypothetical protein
MRKYDERFSNVSDKESGSGSTTPNRKMTYVYLNNNEYIRRSPVVINGFSVVNGVYMGSDTMLSGGIVFAPKLNEYKIYYMKVVSSTRPARTPIIDVLLDFEVLFDKAKTECERFYDRSQKQT